MRQELPCSASPLCRITGGAAQRKGSAEAGIVGFVFTTLSFTIYLEIVLSIKSTNQKHGGFDVTVSLFSWGHPLTTAHA